MPKPTETLATMFNGEKPTVGDQVARLSESVAQQFGLGGIDELANTIEIPREIILFLKTLLAEIARNFNIKDFQEKEAAKTLWERFGVPKTLLAVPIFNQLTDSLVSAHQTTLNKSEKTRSKLTTAIETIRMLVAYYYQEQLMSLQEERQACQKAIKQVDSSHDNYAEIGGVTQKSEAFFAKKIRSLSKQMHSLRKQQDAWLEMMRNMTISLSLVRNILGQQLRLNPDASKAL